MIKISKLMLDYGLWDLSVNSSITDKENPSFSWAVSGAQKNDKQEEYSVSVSDSKGILWEKTEKTSEQCVIYSGEPLPCDVPLDFTLKVKNIYGETAEISSTFIRADAKNTGKWLEYPQDGEFTSAIEFRKSFASSKKVSHAVLYSCGIGYQKILINNMSVDASVLSTPVSDYNKTRYITVIPTVGEFLSETNEIQITVAPGWRYPEDAFFGKEYKSGKRKYFFGEPALSVKLHIFYEDGSEEYILSDETWDVYSTKYVRAQLFGGETYDNTVKPQFLGKAKVSCDTPEKTKVLTFSPITEQEYIYPETIWSDGNGEFICDFGINIAGVCLYTLPAMKNGDTVKIEYAEEIFENGDLYKGTLRDALATDMYISDGNDAGQWWQPDFTYHGFRYIKISGVKYVDKTDIVAVSYRNNVEEIGRFSSGSSILNAVHNTVLRTERGNIMGILTDCPNRDERMGWMNDATVRFEEIPYNFETGKIFYKVLNDIKDQQSDNDGSITCTAPFVLGSRPADPVCSSYLLLALQNYLFSGDREMMAYGYKGFEEWEKCLDGLAEDGIINYTLYGDWAAAEYACKINVDAPGWNVYSLYTPGEFMSTGYYYYNARLLEKYSHILGYTEKEKEYREKSEYIKSKIIDKWWNEDASVMASGSQGCQSFALWLGLIPEEHKAAAAKRIHDDLVLRNYQITTGNLCTRYLMDALSENGYEDDAYKLLTKETYPSIGFMIQKEATTVWERLEEKLDSGMNSHNHPMYGAVDNWMYRYGAGILPTDIGFSEFTVNPVYPKDLQSVNATVNTVKGEITVRWIKRYGKTELRVIVPFGTTAHITVGNEVKTVGSGFYNFVF